MVYGWIFESAKNKVKVWLTNYIHSKNTSKFSIKAVKTVREIIIVPAICIALDIFYITGR